MNAGFIADDPFRNGRAEDKAAESHAGNLSRTWGGDTVSSGTPLFHSYGLDWMGYSLWNGRGPCCPTENSKNSRSVPGRRVLLLRPVQHTGLYGLSAVCKKGRLVPLAQERPFLIFYLGGMYEWALFQIWIMSFKTARLPFPTPLRKMMLWICRRRLLWNRRQQVLRLQLRLRQRRPANRQPPPTPKVRMRPAVRTKRPKPSAKQSGTPSRRKSGGRNRPRWKGWMPWARQNCSRLPQSACPQIRRS